MTDTIQNKLAAALREACDVHDTFVTNGSQPWREVLAEHDALPAAGLPTNIPFERAFLVTFNLVVEPGYSKLSNDPDSNRDTYDSKEDFDADMANALGEACTALNLPHDAETAGALYDILEAAGWRWPTEDEQQADEEYEADLRGFAES